MSQNRKENEKKKLQEMIIEIVTEANIKFLNALLSFREENQCMIEIDDIIADIVKPLNNLPIKNNWLTEERLHLYRIMIKNLKHPGPKKKITKEEASLVKLFMSDLRQHLKPILHFEIQMAHELLSDILTRSSNSIKMIDYHTRKKEFEELLPETFELPINKSNNILKEKEKNEVLLLKTPTNKLVEKVSKIAKEFELNQTKETIENLERIVQEIKKQYLA